MIGARFHPDVTDAAAAAGVVVVVLDAPAFVHTGDRIRIDLDAAKVVNLSSGDRAPIRGMDEAGRARVRATLEARHPMT